MILILFGTIPLYMIIKNINVGKTTGSSVLLLSEMNGEMNSNR